MRAAARMAMSLTGAKDVGAAMQELSRRSKLAVDVEAAQASVTADRAKLEATERRQLVGELVRLGVEIPATAWGDDKGTVPVKRLAEEPIDELRARVKTLAAAARPGLRRVPTPPAAGDNPHGLTERELAMCARNKIDPAKYAATRAGIRARSSNAKGV
jgi:hypothetical protein